MQRPILPAKAPLLPIVEPSLALSFLLLCQLYRHSAESHVLQVQAGDSCQWCGISAACCKARHSASPAAGNPVHPYHGQGRHEEHPSLSQSLTGQPRIASDEPYLAGGQTFGLVSALPCLLPWLQQDCSASVLTEVAMIGLRQLTHHNCMVIHASARCQARARMLVEHNAFYLMSKVCGVSSEGDECTPVWTKADC